jgi:hypothetical protein
MVERIGPLSAEVTAALKPAVILISDRFSDHGISHDFPRAQNRRARIRALLFQANRNIGFSAEIFDTRQSSYFRIFAPAGFLAVGGVDHDLPEQRLDRSAA